MQILTYNYKTVGNKKSLKFGCNENEMCPLVKYSVDALVDGGMQRQNAEKLIKDDVAEQEDAFKKTVKALEQKGIFDSQQAKEALDNMHVIAALNINQNILEAMELNTPYNEVKEKNKDEFNIIKLLNIGPDLKKIIKDSSEAYKKNKLLKINPDSLKIVKDFSKTAKEKEEAEMIEEAELFLKNNPNIEDLY